MNADDGGPILQIHTSNRYAYTPHGHHGHIHAPVECVREGERPQVMEMHANACMSQVSKNKDEQQNGGGGNEQVFMHR